MLLEQLKNEVKSRISEIDLNSMPEGKAKVFITKMIKEYKENGII